ncbi:MAG: hypothetical protein IPL65_09250 [Lewinellaceae bacterium]|nr:hypothetical protein [Lewinellaceae bacterium]
MNENYTYDMLVQFLYHELPADEALLAAQLIEDFSEVRAQWDELRSAKSSLPKAQFLPSNQIITNILQYSTKTALEAQL